MDHFEFKAERIISLSEEDAEFVYDPGFNYTLDYALAHELVSNEERRPNCEQ